MERGRISTNAILHLLRWPAFVTFEPDDFWVGKKTASPLAPREGWYCPACEAIVGIFHTGR